MFALVPSQEPLTFVSLCVVVFFSFFICFFGVEYSVYFRLSRTNLYFNYGTFSDALYSRYVSKTHWWLFAVIRSLVGWLSLRHLSHFHHVRVWYTVKQFLFYISQSEVLKMFWMKRRHAGTFSWCRQNFEFIVLWCM